MHLCHTARIKQLPNPEHSSMCIKPDIKEIITYTNILQRKLWRYTDTYSTLIAMSTSSSRTWSLRCMRAEASAIRMMLSMWRTAMGTPPVTAEAPRSSAYSVAIWSTEQHFECVSEYSVSATNRRQKAITKTYQTKSNRNKRCSIT